MPYIKQEDRNKLQDYAYMIQSCPLSNAGELNYIITLILHKYEDYKGTSYQHYNDMLGALEGAKLEVYRRRVGPYEDMKVKENGDV